MGFRVRLGPMSIGSRRVGFRAGPVGASVGRGGARVFGGLGPVSASSRIGPKRRRNSRSQPPGGSATIMIFAEPETLEELRDRAILDGMWVLRNEPHLAGATVGQVAEWDAYGQLGATAEHQLEAYLSAHGRTRVTLEFYADYLTGVRLESERIANVPILAAQEAEYLARQAEYLARLAEHRSRQEQAAGRIGLVSWLVFSVLFSLLMASLMIESTAAFAALLLLLSLPLAGGTWAVWLWGRKSIREFKERRAHLEGDERIGPAELWAKRSRSMRRDLGWAASALLVGILGWVALYLLIPDNAVGGALLIFVLFQLSWGICLTPVFAVLWAICALASRRATKQPTGNAVPPSAPNAPPPYKGALGT